MQFSAWIALKLSQSERYRSESIVSVFTNRVCDLAKSNNNASETGRKLTYKINYIFLMITEWLETDFWGATSHKTFLKDIIYTLLSVIM